MVSGRQQDVTAREDSVLFVNHQLEELNETPIESFDDFANGAPTHLLLHRIVTISGQV